MRVLLKVPRSFSDDWDTHASQDIRSLFLDPQASKTVVKDAYLVQQGNIYPTQQMARCLGLQYKEELSRLLEEEERQSGIYSAQNGNGSARSDAWMEEKDQVASDLLCILQKIPIQVIGQSRHPGSNTGADMASCQRAANGRQSPLCRVDPA